MKLLEGTHVDEPVLEGNGNIVVLAQELHDLFLAGSLQSGHILELEAEVPLIERCPAFVLAHGLRSLILGGHLPEEVVSMEEPVRPDGDRSKPQRPHSPQPPGVRFRNEVCVVKHRSIIYQHKSISQRRSSTPTPTHHQHVSVLVLAVGQVGLEPHVDHLLRRQAGHLAALVGRLEEGEDVVRHLHLQAVHRVDYDVFGSNAAELALVLREAHIVDLHFAWGFLLLALLVLVKIEGVDRIALEKIEDVDPPISLDSHKQRPREAHIEIDHGMVEFQFLYDRIITRISSASRVFHILMEQSSPADNTKAGSRPKLTLEISLLW